MANAYSLFANGGKQVSPVMIKRVESHTGEVIYEQNPEPADVLRPDLAFVMTHMLTGMFDKKLNGYASVTGSTIINKMTRTYAGKSGSTNTDSWMVGYSPQLVSAVWTGYDDGQALNSQVIKPMPRIFGFSLWKRHLRVQQLNPLSPQRVRLAPTSILRMENWRQRIVR